MKIHIKVGEDHSSMKAIGALVLITLGFWYFTVYERPITNDPDAAEYGEELKIVAFGDSLIQGVGAKQINGGFVTILSERLDLEIVNMGVSGDTTSDAWMRIRSVIDEDPDIVLISLGGNDFLPPRAAKEEVEARLGRIISELHRTGSAVVLLEVPGYYGLHRSVTRQYGNAYVPNILGGMLGKDTYMSDTVHPNDEGYRLIADKVEPVLVKLMR